MTSPFDNFSSLAISGSGADRKILIAVDFGTTYSGLAWAQTRRPEVQTTITQWPTADSQGLEGTTSDKVPTELRYTGDSYQWGFQIKDEDARYQWFKLDLDPSQARGTSELARRYASSNQLPPGYDMTTGKLVTDYLTALRKHAETFLKHKLPESALRSTLIEYIVTTPAVWSDAAQIKTRACAEMAGMGKGDNLQIVSEPEAAAVYALDAMDPHDIKIGDTFVLCDAGGGTVDLISYTVSALKPILKIDEAAPGTGGLCGSTYLNRIFKEFLIAKLGNNEQWDDEVLEEALRRFELVTKRAFTGNTSEKFSIPVHGLVDDPDVGVRRGKFTIQGSDVVKIFEPVLREIVALVKGQIKSTKRKVRAVLLVGGFGQSAYLRDSLRKALGSSTEVLAPPNGWTAVVRGALMKGLADGAPDLQRVNIASRSARKHYGANSDLRFVEHVHKKDKRYYDSFSGCYRVPAMWWYLKKGDTVTEHEPTKFSYFRAQLVNDGPPQTIKLTIQSSSDRIAPVYQDSTVTDLVVLTADLSCIPTRELEQRKGSDGKMYYYLSWHIEMTNYSASTKYELVYKRVRYASVKAEYV